MITRLLPKKLATLLFRSVEAREAFVHQVVELRQQYPNRPIAFALLGGGTIEYWAIRAFLRERFGQDFEPRMATRLPSLVVEDPKTILRRIASKFFINAKPRSRVRQCSDELLRGRPVVLNFEYTDRRRAFETPEGERELTFLAQRVPNLIVVPVVVLWRRKRLIRQVDNDLGHKILSGLLAPIKFPKDILLGDPTQPTFLRKIAILLRQYERSTFRLTTPIEIGATNVKMLRRRVLQQIMQERKVVLGPQMSSPKFIGESILRSAAFTRIVRNLAQEEDVSELSLLKKSQRYFQEIAANFSYFTIESFGWFLSWVFSRVFNDLTFREEDFEKLRLSSREGPLLFLPCHKSYFDFLIMSYILFRNDIAPPHIAAGINLNFWPFGIFAKKAGAFFIRRSFRGNVLYSEILRRYIAALLQNRNNVEFFIEGARSRNGKLAPPKYGMLKMVVDSWYEGLIQEKVRIVPVSICYEKVTEVKSHKRELEGGEKVQESFVNLAKSSKVLFKKFGEVHVRIAEPIPMDHWLRQYVGEPDSVSPDSRKLGIQKLAFEVCHRINRTTPVSPEGLVCAVMLAKPGSAMPKAELEAWLLRLQADLQRMQALLNPSLERDYMGACRRALAGLMEDRIIEKYQTSAGRTGLRVHHKQRIAALYYKNAAIHALLLPAVAGYAGHSQEDLLDLRSLLQFEFFFSEKEVFLKNLLHVPEGLMKELYAHMIEDVFENVAIGLTGLTEMAGTVLEDREWRARLMKFGKASVLESNVRRLEAVNTQSFSAFVEMAKNRKWLVPVASAKPGNFQTGALPEIQKALDKIRSFRGRLMEWDSLRAKYLDVRHEEELSAEGRA